MDVAWGRGRKEEGDGGTRGEKTSTELTKSDRDHRCASKARSTKAKKPNQNKNKRNPNFKELCTLSTPGNWNSLNCVLFSKR